MTLRRSRIQGAGTELGSGTGLAPPVLKDVVRPGALRDSQGADGAARTPAADAPPGPDSDIPQRPDLLMTPYLEASDMAVSFADPYLPDEPLIEVNDAFSTLTGYRKVHCLLRNCRFLQGRQTRRAESAAIRQGINGDFYLITRLLNYRRSGEPFDNVLQVGQVRDTEGRTRFLFGVQWDVTRTRNLLGGSTLTPDLVDRALTPQLERLARLANHLVRRSDALGTGAAGIPLVERLVAMSRPFQFPTPGANRGRGTLRALLEYLLAPYPGVAGSRVRINGSDGEFDVDIVGPLALWLHELASAARQNGALSCSTGIIILSWDFPVERGEPMIAFHWQELRFAPRPGRRVFDPYAPVNREGGVGARVVQDIVEFAGGHVITRSWEDKLDAVLTMPNELGATHPADMGAVARDARYS